jgi:hypothetical protein
MWQYSEALQVDELEQLRVLNVLACNITCSTTRKHNNAVKYSKQYSETLQVDEL